MSNMDNNGGDGSLPETSFGRGPTFTVDSDNKEHVERTDQHGITADTDRGNVDIDKGFMSDGEETDRSSGDTGGEGDGRKESTSEPSRPEALPEFNASDAGVVEKYESTYFKDGQPSMEALSGEWWSSAKRTEDGGWEGSLSESTYKFLESKGFSKDLVKSIEAGQVAQNVLRERAALDIAHDRAGGRESFEKALKWGREGGYSQAQKDHFNQVFASGNPVAIADQIDLLMTRFNGSPKATTGVKPTRTVSSAGGEAAGGGPEGYATFDEYRKDLKAAVDKNDQAAYRKVQEKAKASPWFGKR